MVRCIPLWGLTDREKALCLKRFVGIQIVNITSGKILYQKEPDATYQNLLDMDPVLRAKEGYFYVFSKS